MCFTALKHTSARPISTAHRIRRGIGLGGSWRDGVRCMTGMRMRELVCNPRVCQMVVSAPRSPAWGVSRRGWLLGALACVLVLVLVLVEALLVELLVERVPTGRCVAIPCSPIASIADVSVCRRYTRVAAGLQPPVHARHMLRQSGRVRHSGSTVPPLRLSSGSGGNHASRGR